MKATKKWLALAVCFGLMLGCGSENQKSEVPLVNPSADKLMLATASTANSAVNRYSNVAEDGKFLIDVLFVYTPAAKALMEANNVDPDEHALQHINKNNDDLLRSKITTSKLRYVGKHYVTEEDYIRTNRYPNSSNGTHVLLWLLSLRDAYGADKIAVVHQGVVNNGGGDSVSFPYNPVMPFSHEFGHAMGIGHGGCDGGDYTTLRYANGAQFRWLNFIDGEEALPYPPDAGTIMCGNNSGFYTNANLVLSWQEIETYVNEGHLPNDLSFYEPLRESGMRMGHPDYADAARQWMEVDEAASNNYPTSLPLNYSDSEWYEKDDCLAFYDNVDYANLISEICIGDSISNTSVITSQAESVRIGKNTALRLFSNREYKVELSTLFYSSSNLSDYFGVRSGDLSDTVYIEAFHKDDREAFFASSFEVSHTFGNDRNWYTPNGLTVSPDGSEIFAMHDGIDVFSPDGSLIRHLDVNTAYAFGLGLIATGDLIIPTDQSCRVVDKNDGTVTMIPGCRGTDAEIDSSGNLYIVNRNGSVTNWLPQADGSFVRGSLYINGQAGEPGSNDHFSRSTGIAIDKDRDLMYLVDGHNCRVQVFDLSGNYQRTIGAEPGMECEDSPGRGGRLRSPFGISLDKQGVVYVTETFKPWYFPGLPTSHFNVGVQVFDPTGTFITQFAYNMIDPGYLHVDSEGKVYVMESGGDPDPTGVSKIIVFQKIKEDLSGSYAFRVPGGEFAMQHIYAGGNPSAGLGFGDTYNYLAGQRIEARTSWTLSAVEGEPDTYTIQSNHHGLYLDADDSDQFETNLEQYKDTIVSRPPTGDDSQKWVVKKLENGNVTIQEKISGFFISNDLYIQKSVETNSANTMWIAIPVTTPPASSYIASQRLGEGSNWVTPNGVAVSPDGSEIFALHDGIEMFAADGSLIRHLNVSTAYSFGLSLTAAGDLFIPSDTGMTCRLVDKTSGEVTLLSTCQANDADFDTAGNLYTVSRVGFINKWILQENGSFIKDNFFIDGRLGLPGDNGHFVGSTSIAVDKNQELIYVADSKNCRVQAFNFAGNYQRTLGAEPGLLCENRPAGPGELRSPFGIAVDNQGLVYVSETDEPWHIPASGNYPNVGVQVFDITGTFVTQFAIDMNDPGYLDVDNQGTVYVMESGDGGSVIVFEQAPTPVPLP